MRWQRLLIFVLGLSWSASVSGASLEPADFPSLISSLEISKPLEFCGERAPMEVPEIRERFEKEFLLTLWDRPQVILWLKRSRRYLPPIEKMLKESGMPEEIKYIAIAESALRPHVGSQKGAIGFWQFRRSTGQKYGLVINSRIDERRNIFASTKAAIQYFKELHEIFGSWTLTAAAYNMGEDGLRAEILEQGTRDYYQLYLPLETQRFIFRILSVKLILSDPARYGFKLKDQQYYPPLEFDSVLVDCFQETPIRILAQAARTHFKVIKDLNPEIRGYHLAPGSHKINIPKGASSGFHARYQGLANKFVAAQKGRIYVVQKGDNLSLIAERFGIPLASLIIWNRLDLDGPIHPGDRLIIHRDATKSDERKIQN